MYGTTMMLTIGQALDRAQNDGSSIRLQVGGDWIVGRVLNTDSQGVVVRADEGDLCVVRMDAITCLRISVPAQRVPEQPERYSPE